MADVIKGERFNLTKNSGGGSNFYVGLGWTAPQNTNPAFDLDVSLFGLDANGKLVSDGHFVYFDKDHLRASDGSVLHSPDNLDGGDTNDNIGDDDEWAKMWTGKMDPRVAEWSIVVTIYDAVKRGQNFGMVSKAHVHVAPMDANDMPPVGPDGKVQALVNYPLADDFGKFTAVQVGSVYKRDDGDWAFNPTGVGFENAGLGEILQHYTG